MKIRVGFRDEVKCEMECTDGENIKLTGSSPASVRRLARFYSRQYGVVGEELLRLLLKKLNGHWWAESMADQTSNAIFANFSTDELGHEHAPAGSGKGGQFVAKGQGGTSTTNTPETKAEKRDRRAKQNEAKKSTALKVGETARKVTSTVTKSVQELVTGKPQKVSVQVHKEAIKKAIAKADINPEPTPDELKENLAGLERLGANKYRRGLVGNSSDRRARRVKLLKEFGDGNTCPCIYCGTVIGHGTMEQDKIYTTAQGGRYRQVNIIPACKSCNNLRGDMPWTEAIKKVVRFVRADAEPESATQDD